MAANSAINSNQNDIHNGDIGHIREILLKNFMCHKHFHLQFGPRINFIVGQNGSGKSAILIGIVLGLGGRASCTNRGSGLSLFIKNGESRAQITLKIANFIDGKSTDESYKYDRYGKTIIVERTISINGTSSYKLKSESGKIISEKKEELDNILSHFCIFIDNPICVLTQEISKNFLNSKNASDKFKFFIKATQIEETKRLYDSCKEDYEYSKKKIAEKDELLKSYNEKLEKYRKEVNTIEKLRNNVNLMKQLNNELHWACINEYYKELNENIAKLDDNKKNIEKYDNERNDIQQEINEINQQKAELDERLHNFTSMVKQTQNDSHMAKKESEDMRSQLIKKESEMNVVKKELSKCRSEINGIRKRIDGIETNSQECQHLNIEDLIKKLDEEMTSKKSKNQSLKLKLIELQQLKDQQVNEKIHIEEEVRKNQAQMKVNQSEILRLRSVENNRLGRYGPKYTELNKQIDLLHKNKKFKHKPFGPIGEYIRLNDNKAAYAVEIFLKRMLFAYVVDNDADACILKDLVSRLFRGDLLSKPSIIIRKFVPLHNVSRSQAISPNYKNFLQLLNIKREDDPVANCLIDHQKVEQVLYIPNYREAQHILSRRELVPNNCIRCYTSDGDLMYPSTNHSDYKSYPNRNQNKFARILVENHTQTIENCRKQIDFLQEKIENLCHQLREQNRLIEENKKEIAMISHEISQCEIEQHDLESQRSELEAKAAIKPVEAVALKDEVFKLEEEQIELKNQLQKLAIVRDDLKNKYNELLKKCDDKQQEYENLRESRDPITEKIEKLNDKQRVLMNRSEKKTNDYEKLLESESKLEREIEVHQQKLHEQEQLALKETETRIETTRSSAEIGKEISDIEKYLEINKHIMDPKVQEQTFESFYKLQQSTSNVKIELDALNTYFSKLETSSKSRETAYHMLISYIEKMVNIHFQEFLKHKEFEGYIDIKFHESSNSNSESEAKRKAKTLDLVIRPHKSLSQSQYKSSQEIHSFSNTKSLSGGERSFSTVAFIISLWQVCPSPFRILDEVDVFMDMVTRHITLDSLVEFAATKSNKQFIFLSPLSLQQFNHSQFIKIFQMPEPARK